MHIYHQLHKLHRELEPDQMPALVGLEAVYPCSLALEYSKAHFFASMLESAFM